MSMATSPSTTFIYIIIIFSLSVSQLSVSFFPTEFKSNGSETVITKAPVINPENETGRSKEPYHL